MTSSHQLDAQAFERWRETQSAAWLAIFVADWCQPCHALLSRLASLSADSPVDLPIGVLDVDLEPTLAERYGVRGVPTLTLFVGDELKATQVGALSEQQLIQFCEEVIRS